MTRIDAQFVIDDDFSVTDDELRLLEQQHPEYAFAISPQTIADPEVLIGWPRPSQLRAPGLRWLQIPSVGYDRYAADGVPDAIVLTNGRGVFSEAIAEHAIALLLALYREVPAHVRRTVRREWMKSRTARELNGSRVLVAGTGAIGRAIAKSLTALGCSVVGVSRSGTPVEGFSAVLRAPLTPADVIQFDIIVLALPRTAATTGFWSAELSAAVKPGWCFVNVGRGDTVDEEGLIAALETGHLVGAGLDVTAAEPLAPDSPFWDDERVILTSHSAGATPRRQERFLELLHENLIRYASGRQLRNVVDLAAGY